MAEKTKDQKPNTSNKKTKLANNKVIEIKDSLKNSNKLVNKDKDSKKTSKTTSITQKDSQKNTQKNSQKNSRDILHSKRSPKYTTNSRKNILNKSKRIFKTEYYDLPNQYNKTMVKILAQTPTTLFVYWELSEDDRKSFIETYGANFFEVTKPILIVYNDTLHYSFEIEINDFANSWYIHINDSKCNYRVELGRKPLSTANQFKIESIPQISNNSSTNNEYLEIEKGQNIDKNAETKQSDLLQQKYIPFYVYISSSNDIAAPNNKVLLNLNNISKTIKFRNIKNNQIIEKDIRHFKFITNFGIFSISELYKHLYPNENFELDNNFFSGNPSSGSFSSQFK